MKDCSMILYVPFSSSNGYSGVMLKSYSSEELLEQETDGPVMLLFLAESGILPTRMIVLPVFGNAWKR